MIDIPTLAEHNLLKKIAELKAETDMLKELLAEAKKRNRKIANENCRLRAMTGVSVRISKKSACIANYKVGITGSALAKLSGCTVRYANQIIKTISETGD